MSIRQGKKFWCIKCSRHYPKDHWCFYAAERNALKAKEERENEMQ